MVPLGLVHISFANSGYSAATFILLLGFPAPAFLGFALGRRILQLQFAESVLAAAVAAWAWQGFRSASLLIHVLQTNPSDHAPHSITLIILLLAMIAAACWLFLRPPVPLQAEGAGFPKLVRRAHIIFGVLLLLWLFLAQGDLFLLLVHTQNAIYEHFRLGCICLYQFYPLFYGVGWMLSRFTLRRGMPSACTYSAFLPLVPLLAQAVLILAMFLPHSLLHRFHIIAVN